jgi:hypothetical protein
VDVCWIQKARKQTYDTKENDEFLRPIQNIQALSKLQGVHKMWVETLNANTHDRIVEQNYKRLSMSCVKKWTEGHVERSAFFDQVMNLEVIPLRLMSTSFDF